MKFLTGIKTIGDVEVFLWTRGFSEFEIIEEVHGLMNPGGVFITIRHFFFRLGKLRKEIAEEKPIGVTFGVRKITFFYWLKIKLSHLIRRIKNVKQ